MPRPEGLPKTGGRVKGAPNRSTLEVQELLARLDCDPIEGMVLIAQGKVPCGVCMGAGKTKYQPAHGHTSCSSAPVNRVLWQRQRKDQP